MYCPTCCILRPMDVQDETGLHRFINTTFGKIRQYSINLLDVQDEIRLYRYINTIFRKIRQCPLIIRSCDAYMLYA